MAANDTDSKALDTVEVDDAEVFHEEGLSDDRIDALVALAERIPQLEKAQKAIFGYILRIALPGDWVAFTEQDGTKKVELSGPGAERVASQVGISFIDWKEPKKQTGTDSNGPWYSWWYECTAKFGQKRYEMIQGRAGTRDLFFGKAKGEWKNAEDVKEDDLKTAARRACIKEGVKLVLGLRRIPLDVALKMGLDVGKVKTVEFDNKAKTLSADQTKPAEDGLVSRDIVVATVVKGASGTSAKGQPWNRWDVTDKEGVRYSLFAPEDSRRLLALQLNAEDQTPIKIKFQNKQFTDKSGKPRDSYQIMKVEGVEE